MVGIRKLLHLFRKPFFTDSENDIILSVLRESEKKTSAEIRIFIEQKNPYIESSWRALEVFRALKMDNTIHRNAVLIYIAYVDHEFALYADKEAYRVLDNAYWENLAKQLAKGFKEKKYVTALCECLLNLGMELEKQFPHQGEQKNELPDEIVFGK
jgi:Predicted membrane protein